MYQVGNKEKLIILRCTVNNISRFAMLNKQNGYTDIKTSKQNCTNVMQPYGTTKYVGQTTVLSQRPHDKDICRGGEYHRLHVQFIPPDDGPVRPETCRGKRIADIVRRQKKNSVSSWK